MKKISLDLNKNIDVTKRRDYNQYMMKPLDIAFAFAVGFAGAFIVFQIFFGAPVFSIIMGAVCGIVAQPVYRKIRIGQEKKQLMMQFNDMLDSISTSYSSGKNTYASFCDVQNDMAMQYGEKSAIYYELEIINNGLQNGQTIEELLVDFGSRSHEEDIITFANVFQIANRRGGNLKNVLTETRNILCDKIEIEREIKTTITAAQGQLNVMMLMPLIIVPMMGSFTAESPDQTVNIIVKLAGIAIFAIAYLIGRKITNIKL